jgi:hypothetical protein
MHLVYVLDLTEIYISRLCGFPFISPDPSVDRSYGGKVDVLTNAPISLPLWVVFVPVM